MTTVVLDTGVLGMVVHPSNRNDNGSCKQWLRDLLANGGEVYIPEIADYELRRSLLQIESKNSIAHLDQLESVLHYLQLDTASIRLAAELWAEARQKGYPTAGDQALDGDVILAAQTRQLTGGSVVATTNVAHLSRFVNAERWRDISF